MKRVWTLTLACVLALSAAQQASAVVTIDRVIFEANKALYGNNPVIYDNEADPTTGVLAGPATNRLVADDFVLQAGASTATDLHWRGVYVDNVAPQEPGTFTIRFFEDANGAPALTPMTEFSTFVDREATGETIAGGGGDVYRFSTYFAPIAFLPDTTYWASVYSDDHSTFYWALQSNVGNAKASDNFTDGISGWSPQNADHLDFQITGPRLAVPEPATATLAVMTLAGLTLTRRRRPA